MKKRTGLCDLFLEKEMDPRKVADLIYATSNCLYYETPASVREVKRKALGFTQRDLRRLFDGVWELMLTEGDLPLKVSERKAS